MNQIAYSGTPDSSTIIYLSAPTFPYGRGDMGRTPVLTQTDLMIRHRIHTAERTQISLEVNTVNLFDQVAMISRTTQLKRSGAISGAVLPPEATGFFAAYGPAKYMTANGGGGTTPINPIYNLPGSSYRNGGSYDVTKRSAFFATFPGFGAYQEGRVLRIALRFVF